MNADQAHKFIIEQLASIAPEADFAALDPAADLREMLDIDSLDFLNFISALHKKGGIDVPERDYRRLLTLDGAVAYLVEKSA